MKLERGEAATVSPSLTSAELNSRQHVFPTSGAKLFWALRLEARSRLCFIRTADSISTTRNLTQFLNSRKHLSTEFEAYGVIIAPSLGECRWQSLRTNNRERKPVLRWHYVADSRNSAQWILRLKLVIDADLNCLPLAYPIKDRSLINVPLVGIPASAAIA